MKNITQLNNFPQYLKDIFDAAYSRLMLVPTNEWHSYKVLQYNDARIFDHSSKRFLKNLDIDYIMFFSVKIPYKTHIDPESPVGLNIPANGCKNGITYAAKTDCLDKILKSKISKIFSHGKIDEFDFDPADYDFFDQSVPYFLNTHVPHGGYSKNNNETRNFWSIRFKKKYTYHDMVKKFSSWQ